YLDLVRGAVDNVAALGPASALTGPVARGDHDTVARHLAALDPAERTAYEVLSAEAQRLVASRTAAESRPVGSGGVMATGRELGRRPITVVDRVARLRKELEAARGEGRTVGLVPTMGYLHDGHAALIRQARAECDV